MDIRCLWGPLLRVTFSLLCAGLFYTGWLAVFLLSARLGNSVVEVIGWLLAPVVTAAGFTAGLMIMERLTRRGETKFLRLFIWPLIGCAVGAGTVYWFGPMLIVFGMFMAGTASVALREVALSIERDKN